VCDIDGNLQSHKTGRWLTAIDAQCGSKDEERKLRKAVTKYPGVGGDGAKTFEIFANEIFEPSHACVFELDER
jgi:hypothetical protein